jgi:hypothetical protein
MSWTWKQEENGLEKDQATRCNNMTGKDEHGRKLRMRRNYGSRDIDGDLVVRLSHTRIWLCNLAFCRASVLSLSEAPLPLVPYAIPRFLSTLWPPPPSVYVCDFYVKGQKISLGLGHGKWVVTPLLGSCMFSLQLVWAWCGPVVYNRTVCEWLVLGRCATPAVFHVA